MRVRRVASCLLPPLFAVTHTLLACSFCTVFSPCPNKSASLQTVSYALRAGTKIYHEIMSVGEHPKPSTKGSENGATGLVEQKHPQTGHVEADAISDSLDFCGGRWLCISSAACSVLGLLLCWNAYLLARAHTLLASSFCYLFSPSSNESELFQKVNKEARAVVHPQVIRERDRFRQKYLDSKKQHLVLEVKYFELLEEHSEVLEQQMELLEQQLRGSPSRRSAKKNSRGRRNGGSDMQRRLNNLEKENRRLNEKQSKLSDRLAEQLSKDSQLISDNLLKFCEDGEGFGEQLKDVATALRVFVDTTKKTKGWAEEKLAENQKLTAQLAEEKAEKDKLQNELNELKFRDLEMVD